MRSVTRSFFLLALLTTGAFAATTRTPSLTISGDDQSVALQLEAVRIEVLIRGHLARTRFELTYRNHLDRDVDGDFAFPIPLDAEVSDVALYFGGRLRHAVAVERVQARAAYQEVIHRGVDPILAEWNSSTREFHFRVYPIPARSTKVVHVAYDQELTAADFELDLRYDLIVRSLDLTLDSDVAVGSEGIPLAGFAGRVSTRHENFLLNGVLRAIPDRAETALVAFSPGDRRWYASAPLRVRSESQPVAPARHLLLLVDVSSSASGRDDAKLREFLLALLDRQQKPAGVSVIPFHIHVEPVLQTDRAGLDHTLARLSSAGATNLIALLERLPALIASAPENARIVLVTDGLNTLGDSRSLTRAAERVAGTGRPLTIVNASPSANDIFLGGLARSTGGWYVDLTRVDLERAAESAMWLPSRIEVRSPLPQVLDFEPRTLLVSRELTATINARSPDRIVAFPVVAERRHEIPVQQLDSEDGIDLIRRAWGRARLKQLLESGEPDEVLRHGREFNQITPRTSLLVLDSWQDYEQYGVPMPPEVAAVRARETRLATEGGWIEVRGTTSDPQAELRSVWSVSGVVTHNEMEIPGVTITLTANEFSQTTVTSEEGRFVLWAARAPVALTLSAEIAGFETVRRSFPAGLSDGSVLEIVLRVGLVAETITVSAQSSSAGGIAGVEGGVAFSLAASVDRSSVDETGFASRTISRPRPHSRSELDALIKRLVARLRSTSSSGDRMRVFVEARPVLGGNKIYYAQAALAIHQDDPHLGARFLSELSEEFPDDAATLRIAGRVLEGWGRVDLARLMFERALELSPREPQTWRELLLLEAKHGTEETFSALRERYHSFQKDPRHERSFIAFVADLPRIRNGADPRRDEAAELQIEAMWDLDYTDVDLHVIEPGGEEVSYEHVQSKNGGRLHEDVTSGFGPEVYTLPRVRRGRYQILLGYYAADATRVSSETLVHVITWVRGERRDFLVSLIGGDQRKAVATIGDGFDR